MSKSCWSLIAHLPGARIYAGFEWYYLWRLSHRFSSTLRHNDSVLSVAFSLDGSGSRPGVMITQSSCGDADTGREMLTLKGAFGCCPVGGFLARRKAAGDWKPWWHSQAVGRRHWPGDTHTQRAFG